ncbi:MAG: hypothetical protein ACYC23_23890, partial [Limisphaerales bacterium]
MTDTDYEFALIARGFQLTTQPMKPLAVGSGRVWWPRAPAQTNGALLLATLLTALVSGCGPTEPRHAGKSLSTWFDEAVEVGHPRQFVEIREAFSEFEGDAIGFLVGQIESGLVAPPQATNAWLIDRAVGALENLGFRAPPGNPWERTHIAFDLLRFIATQQRELFEAGVVSPKPSITNAFPLLQRVLLSGEPGEALSTIQAAGPLAVEFLPELRQRLISAGAEDPNLVLVMLAMGRMGPTAVPDIPLLAAVAGDAGRPFGQRGWAADALGRFGPASQAAAPVITDLLLEASAPASDALPRPHLATTVTALASVGTTPDAAVPVLRRLTLSTNERVRAAASIALWNRQPEDARLNSEISAALTSTNPGPTVQILSRLGANASVFASQIQALTNHADPFVRLAAARILR